LYLWIFAELVVVSYKAYDKNTNGLINFHEMIDFCLVKNYYSIVFEDKQKLCRTVIHAPREEQIVGLYQTFQDLNH
jgi:hypothetical protein